MSHLAPFSIYEVAPPCQRRATVLPWPGVGRRHTRRPAMADTIDLAQERMTRGQLAAVLLAAEDLLRA